MGEYNPKSRDPPVPLESVNCFKIRVLHYVLLLIKAIQTNLEVVNHIGLAIGFPGLGLGC